MYFEAHGTGTPVGDPIEAGAIGAAFRRFRSNVAPLYIGSVKSNKGQLKGASGVAGVIKIILALEAGVAADATLWPCLGLRRASVQSFGFGGANSHVVLDDAYNTLRLAGVRGNHNTPRNHQRSLAWKSLTLEDRFIGEEATKA
ncbi:thiolase-like protein [Tothia fuscella]|uniref:Thiolase-like protein n=1 Tax=Tothia fuscella TaxID=1048955 RepID=A0A9P4NSF7_9PEZI|nr:thiolase-like protein [Tothia fuscella]